jgi:hypothetical protein
MGCRARMPPSELYSVVAAKTLRRWVVLMCHSRARASRSGPMMPSSDDRKMIADRDDAQRHRPVTRGLSHAGRARVGELDTARDADNMSEAYRWLDGSSVIAVQISVVILGRQTPHKDRGALQGCRTTTQRHGRVRSWSPVSGSVVSDT